MIAEHKRISACHRCGGFDERGVCRLGGLQITEQARLNVCPLSKFEGIVDDPFPDPPSPCGPPAKRTIPLAGDVVEAIAKRVGADRLAKWYERWSGKGCGCAERKAKLNAISERLLRRFTERA